MSFSEHTFEDCFNLLCGKKLGEGVSRKVFACSLNSEWVVKVEDSEYRRFQNILEWEFWNVEKEYKPVAQWLAPCRYISPDGRLLIQERVAPLREDELPEKIPAFFTDTKVDNFGKYKGKIVCCDYAIRINNPSIRLKKADWW